MAGTPQENSELIRRILQAAPEDRQRVIEQHLLTLVGEIAGLDISEIPPDKPLDRLGLDSMMALEVQQDLQQNLGIPIGMEQFMQNLSISGLGRMLLDALLQDRDHEHDGLPTVIETITPQRFVEGSL